MNEEIFCRMAPSLGELEGTPLEAWGTPEYEGDLDAPTVFFGLYGLSDFYTLWRHRGKKWILWAGSDIRHFDSGYWLDQVGDIKLDPKALAKWINENCESWVENEIEQKVLQTQGIKSQVCPSFMGDLNKYEVEYKWSEVPKVYASVSGDDFNLYRWDGVEKLAKENPDIEFHLYGNTKPWESRSPNIVVHGRVKKHIMNAEIKKMQGGLRLLKFDGFSEILAKSVLWGQYPVSAIEYPHMLPVEEISRLHAKHHWNAEGRNHYLGAINKFPWNQK